MSKKQNRRSKNVKQRNTFRQFSPSSDLNRRRPSSWVPSLYQRMTISKGFFKAMLNRPHPRSQDRQDLGIVALILKKGAMALTCFTLIAVATVMISDLFSGNKVVINSFHITGELQSKLDEKSIASRLSEHISVIIYGAKSIKKSQAIDVPAMSELPDIPVPASGLSIKTLMRYIRAFPPLRYVKNLLGVNPTEVNGEAWLEGGRVHMTLRITKDVPEGDSEQPKKLTPTDPNNLEPLFAEASEKIMAFAEPYLYAAYLYRTKQTEKALDQINDCLNRNSDKYKRMSLILNGLILMDEGKNEESISKFAEATKVKTVGGESQREIAVATSNWGLALLAECKFKDAIDKFRESIQYDSQLAGTYANYAKALMDSGESADAKRMLDEALTRDRDAAMPYLYLGNMLADRNPGDAIIEYKTAILKDPDCLEAYVSLGAVLVEKFHNDGNKAFEALDKAIELDKNFALAYYNRALAWAEVEKFKEAIKDGELAVSLYKKKLEAAQGCGDLKKEYLHALNNLGWFYEMDTQYLSAVANYQKAIDIDPKYYFAYTGKADALRKWGRVKESIAIYQWVLKQNEADENSRTAANAGLNAIVKKF